jgi:hypothetical protein
MISFRSSFHVPRWVSGAEVLLLIWKIWTCAAAWCVRLPLAWC